MNECFPSFLPHFRKAADRPTDHLGVIWATYLRLLFADAAAARRRGGGRRTETGGLALRPRPMSPWTGPEGEREGGREGQIRKKCYKHKGTDIIQRSGGSDMVHSAIWSTLLRVWSCQEESPRLRELASRRNVGSLNQGPPIPCNDSFRICGRIWRHAGCLYRYSTTDMQENMWARLREANARLGASHAT